MHNNKMLFDAVYFLRLIDTRCGEREYLIRMKISRDHFEKLMRGEAQFKQDEMVRTVMILNLSENEFMKCFFYI